MAATLVDLFHRAVIAPLGAAWPFGIVVIAVLAFVVVDIAWLRPKRRRSAATAEGAGDGAASSSSARLTVDLRGRRLPPR